MNGRGMIALLVLVPLLVAIFAKQIAGFNARLTDLMPSPLQRFCRWERFGRAPDDPMLIAITRVACIVLAIVLLVTWRHY